VIYVDSSVLLARLFAESRSPAEQFWSEALISSRLLEYEVWNRVHARGLAGPHLDNAQELLALVDLVELAPHVLVRALEPFPVPVRTLDGLHLASMVAVRATGTVLELASYDARLAAAAQALGIPVASL
jgi:predicted nucleic acid-binding protein